MSPRWRYFFPGYVWALPNTLIGLVLLCTWYFPRRIAWRDGCLEVIPHRSLIGAPWVGAQTWGWVIFARDEDQAARADLMVHERVHVVQAFVLGPIFLLAWGLHWIWRWVVLLWRFGLGGEEWKDAYYGVWAEKMAYKVGDACEQDGCDGAWGDR